MNSRRSWFYFLGSMLAFVAAGTLLYIFPPASTPFYPRCMFHAVTGLDCPGCGSLRAMHQLLHGNLKEAFRLNPLFIFLLPMLVLFIGREMFKAITGRELFRFSLPRIAVWPLVTLIFIFTIIRNLPVFHF